MEPTKRNTIRAVGQVYDLLGLAAPVTIRMKMLLQDLYRARLSWDQPLEGELLVQWNQLIERLKRCKPVSVPRHYFERSEGSVRKVRLCGFCDASRKAYAAVIYVCFESECGCMASIQTLHVYTRYSCIYTKFTVKSIYTYIHDNVKLATR